MSKDSLTFALEGDIVLDQFAEAINSFNIFLKNLSIEVGQGVKVEWMIEELYAGSAVATFHGISEDIDIVEKIVTAYEDVGESLAAGLDIPFSENIKNFASNLTKVIDGRISAIRFETPSKDYVISGKAGIGETIPAIKYSQGTVKGIIQTLSSRKKLSFTMWDSLFDHAVNCYLKEGSEETMRGVWGKYAAVSGRIGRRSTTGRPVVIRDVRYIRVVEDVKPGSYKNAKGVIPWIEGDKFPEEIIRRLRDA